jgi:hypothetical protein
MSKKAGRRKLAPASEPLNFRRRDELLRDHKNAAFYLEQILKGDNIELFQEALRTVARVQKGGPSRHRKFADAE